MPLQQHHGLPARDIPELDGPVLRPRHQPLTVGSHADREDVVLRASHVRPSIFARGSDSTHLVAHKSASTNAAVAHRRITLGVPLQRRLGSGQIPDLQAAVERSGNQRGAIRRKRDAIGDNGQLEATQSIVELPSLPVDRVLVTT